MNANTIGMLIIMIIYLGAMVTDRYSLFQKKQRHQ